MTQFDYILYHILTTLLLFHVTKCTNFTIIYDEIFENDIRYNNTRYERWTQNVTYISIQQNRSSLFTMMSFDKDSEDVFIFFTQRASLIERSLIHVTEERKINFATSIQSMVHFLQNTPYEICLDYSAGMKRSIISLVYSIFLQDVAIVTDNTECILDFYNSLKSAILHHKINNQLHTKIHHVIYDPNQPINQHNKFYTLKTIDISLIILLVPAHHSTQIFKDAEHFALLGSSQLWMIPNYKEVTSTSYPARTLTFSLSLNSNIRVSEYRHLATTIPKLLESYSIFDAECKKKNTLNHSFCIKTKLYNQFHDHEFDYRNANLELNIKYRNLADKETNWISVSSEIVGDEFYVNDKNIALLRPVTGNMLTQNSIRAVAVIDEPYCLEDKENYDDTSGTCAAGIKCRKPIKDGITKNYTYTCCIGYVVEFFQLILNDLNLEVDMYLIEDNKYGALNDGRWNGLIGDVAYGKADIAVGGISITGERSTVVDFTLPWVEIDMGVLVKPNIIALDFINFEFIAPLASNLQIILWITVLGAMVIVYTLENNRYFLSLTKKNYVREKYYSPYESMSYIGGVTLQRDLGGINPKKPGARISAVVFAFGMVVVITTYTALLVEQGVKREEQDPFIGSKDPRMRNPTSKYKFATVKSSSYETFFRNSENDVFKRVSRFMEKYNLNSAEDAVKKVKEGTIDAFIYDYDFLVWYVSRDRDCALRVQKDALIPSGLGFALSKNFQWLSNFNQAVLRYRESDELQTLHRKWFFIGGGCSMSGVGAFKIRLGINNFGGLFLLLIGTIVACFPMLLPEHIYMKYFQNKLADRIRNYFRPCQKVKGKNGLYTVNNQKNSKTKDKQ